MLYVIALIIIVVALAILIPQYIKVNEFKRPDIKTLIMSIATTALLVFIRGWYLFVFISPVVYYLWFSAFLFFMVYSLIKILRNKGFEKNKKAIITILVCTSIVIVSSICR